MLIRFILTENVLKEKMHSLIDKHHRKLQINSSHLSYGMVKELAERMNLDRKESRKISIKMINIVKSFDQKLGLENLFERGWSLAQRTPSAAGNAGVYPEASGSGEAGLPGQAEANDSQLDKIIERINQKVSSFSRRPRARKQDAAQVPEVGADRPARRARENLTHTLPARAARQENLCETLSQQIHSSREVDLDVEGDRMSRVDLSDSHTIRQRQIPDICSVLSDSVREDFEQTCLMVGTVRDVERQNGLKKIMKEHAALIRALNSPSTEESLKGLTMKLCKIVKQTVLIEKQRGK